MTGDILPRFAEFGPHLGGAASEVVFRADEFKIRVREDTQPESDIFPPELSDVVGVIGAFAEPDGSVRAKYIVAPREGGAEIEQLNQAFMDGYEVVTDYHDMAGTLGRTQNVFDYYEAASAIARQERLLTVASFVLCEGVETGNLYSALYVPRRIFTDLPLRYRQRMQELSKLGESLGLPSFGEMAERAGAKDAYQGLMQNDPRIGSMGVFAAALFLPRIDKLRQSLGMDGLPPQSTKQQDPASAREAALRAKAARKPKKR